MILLTLLIGLTAGAAQRECGEHLEARRVSQRFGIDGIVALGARRVIQVDTVRVSHTLNVRRGEEDPVVIPATEGRLLGIQRVGSQISLVLGKTRSAKIVRVNFSDGTYEVVKNLPTGGLADMKAGIEYSERGQRGIVLVDSDGAGRIVSSGGETKDFDGFLGFRPTQAGRTPLTWNGASERDPVSVDGYGPEATLLGGGYLPRAATSHGVIGIPPRLSLEPGLALWDVTRPGTIEPVVVGDLDGLSLSMSRVVEAVESDGRSYATIGLDPSLRSGAGDWIFTKVDFKRGKITPVLYFSERPIVNVIPGGGLLLVDSVFRGPLQYATRLTRVIDGKATDLGEVKVSNVPLGIVTHTSLALDGKTLFLATADGVFEVMIP